MLWLTVFNAAVRSRRVRIDTCLLSTDGRRSSQWGQYLMWGQYHSLARIHVMPDILVWFCFWLDSLWSCLQVWYWTEGLILDSNWLEPVYLVGLLCIWRGKLHSFNESLTVSFSEWGIGSSCSEDNISGMFQHHCCWGFSKIFYDPFSFDGLQMSLKSAPALALVYEVHIPNSAWVHRDKEGATAE